jgi:hypothetical protein
MLVNDAVIDPLHRLGALDDHLWDLERQLDNNKADIVRLEDLL